MTGADRIRFFKRHALGLSCLLLIYVFLTIVRDFRDGFGIEIWKAIAPDGKPDIYAKSETLIAVAVTIICGATMMIRKNRTALFASLGGIGVGLVIVGGVTLGFQGGAMAGFTWMVLGGLGFYIPYVIFHTTLFERLIATFKDKSNIGYLMYLADAVGYLGLDRVFTGNMTGNVVILGMGLPSGRILATVAPIRHRTRRPGTGT